MPMYDEMKFGVNNFLKKMNMYIKHQTLPHPCVSQLL